MKDLVRSEIAGALWSDVVSDAFGSIEATL